MLTLQRLSLPILAVLTGSALFALAAGPGRAGRAPVPASLPAPNLTRPASAEKAPDPDGFIQRWLVLEPIPLSLRSNAVLNDSFVQATVKTAYFPDQLTIVPRDGAKVTVGGAEYLWHAVDTTTFNLNLYRFAFALGKPRLNVLFWAVTIIDCPREMSKVRLSVGSNSASIWWVNGTEVVDLYGDRHMVIGDGASKRLTLAKGPNIIRCALINGPGVSDLNARIIDDEDRPVKDYTIKLDAAVK